MSERDYSRRQLLRTGAGALIVGSLAGCTDSLTGGNGDGNGDGNSTTTPVTTTATEPGNGTGTGTGGGGVGMAGQIVPARAEMVAHIDFAGMAGDQNLWSIGDAFLAELATMPGYDGPESVQEAVEAAEREAQQESDDTEIDSDSIESMTIFSEVEDMDEDNPYSGAVISTAWAESEFTDLLDDSEEEYTVEEYNGITIYVGSEDPVSEDVESVVAWLGNGQMAAGPRAVVEDIIDVYNGDSQGMSGDLRSHYSNASQGYIRFASLVPPGTFPQNQEDQEMGPNWEPFQNIQYISGSFVSREDIVSLSINHHTGTSQQATAVRDEVENLLGLAGVVAGESETASKMLDSVTATTSGSTVITAFEDDVESLEGYAQEAAKLLISQGMNGGVESEL